MSINIREFEKVGTGVYKIPNYEFSPAIGRIQRVPETPTISLDYVRGTKESGAIQSGTLDGHLLSVCKDHLIEVSGQVPSDWTAAAIEYIEKAIVCLETRSVDRDARGVTGTLEK